MRLRESCKASHTQTQVIISTEIDDTQFQVGFGSNFVAIEQDGYTNIESETPAQLPPGESHVANCWTVSSQQKELLNRVRSPEKCREKFLNRADLDIIMNSIHYKGYNLMADRVALKRRAFKFIFYLTRQKIALNQTDIACLLEELKRAVDDPGYMSFKAKNYLILSLSNVIHNNQLLPSDPNFDIDNILVDQLNNVYYRVELQYQPTAILILKALVKRGYQLTERDVEYLLSWLDMSKPLTQVVLGENNHFEKIGYWKTLTWLSQERSIRSFKRDSEANVKLSEEAIKHSVSGWKSIKKLNVNAKSACIVYHQSHFVQANFPYYERTLNCLKYGLKSHEIKIRDRSIFALNNFLQSDRVNREKFNVCLAEAMAEYRELALDILTQFTLTNPGIDNKTRWRSILKPLTCAAAQANVAKKAKYLNDFLGFNLDSQIEQLTNVKKSVNTTKLFFDIAKGGVDIGKAIVALITLIKVKGYPVEAKVNALLALAAYLENHVNKINDKRLFNLLLSYLIGEDFFIKFNLIDLGVSLKIDFTSLRAKRSSPGCLDNTGLPRRCAPRNDAKFELIEVPLINAALKYVAYSISYSDEYMLHEVIRRLSQIKFDRRCLLNATFLFSKLLERIDSVNEESIQLSIKFLLSYSEKLIISNDIRDAIEDLLYLSVKQVTHVQQSLVDEISEYIRKCPVRTIDKLLVTICDGLTKSESIILNEDACRYLVSSFSHYELQTKQIVLQIFIKQMKNSKKNLSILFLLKFSEFLQQPELVDLILNILSKQVEYKGWLSQNILLKVFSVLEQKNPDHEYLTVKLLLDYLENYNPAFRQEFIESINVGLPSMVDAVYSKMLLILIRASKQSTLDFFHVIDNCVNKFKYGLSTESRRNFANFLDSMAKQSECYSVNALIQLSSNLNLFDSTSINLAINFLEAQFIYHESQINVCPEDYYIICDYIEKFVCQRMLDFNVVGLKKILSIFNITFKYKYALSHDSQLLAMLSDLLYTIEDKTLRDMILVFLNHKKPDLSADIAFTLELDQISLTRNIAAELTFIQKCLYDKKQLTKNNYIVLEELLTGSDSEYVGEVFQICQLAITQDVLVPSRFLSALLNFSVECHNVSSISIAMMVDEAIKRNINMPKARILFTLVEEEMLREGPSSESLRVLYKAVIEGVKLKSNTLDVLLELLTENNINHMAISAKILSEVIKQYSIFSVITIHELVSKFKAVISVELIIPLINVLLAKSSEFPACYKYELHKIQDSFNRELDQFNDDGFVQEKVNLPQKKDIIVPDWIKRFFSEQLNAYEFPQVTNKIKKLGWNESETRDVFRRLDLKNFTEISAFLDYLYTSEPTASLNFLNRLEFIEKQRSCNKMTFPNLCQIMLGIHVKVKFLGRRGEEQLSKYFFQLYQKRHWPIVKIYEILVKLQAANIGFEQLQNILDVLLAYKKISYSEVLRVLQNTPADKLYDSLQRLRLRSYMLPMVNDKPIEQLLSEIKYEWRTFTNVKEIILQADCQESNYMVQSKIIDEPKQICYWDKDIITRWAKKLKSSPWREDHLPEILKVINHCIKIRFKDYYLRHSQLLAILTLLDKPDAMGRIAEVATGEGKSHIIAAFAVIQALRGKKVDIVTSASTLAERDVKLYADFYDLFGLKAASNVDPAYTSGLKDCYKPEVDIIYSDADGFQFDWLRTHFNKLGTRGDRQPECVIVDEVDNLLIDETSRLAMLADEMPGMASLMPIHFLLWKRLLELKGDKKKLSERDKCQLMDYAEALVAPNSENLFIPNHLRGFVEIQKKKWVESACLADELQSGCHYEIKIREGGRHEITPIDASNTGMLQSGTLWQNGLHQFLQIKHGLKVDAERLTTNFMSNIAFFKKYGSELYGITGTLGSEKSQKLLEKTYTLDCVNVPRHKERPFIELESEFACSNEEWIERIQCSVLRESRLGRPVLVICEFKEYAERFQKIFESQSQVGRVIPYYDNESDQGDKIKAELKPGDIVVATNLAGRGTDLSLTQSAQNNGGLHVCITFLPSNQRVEDQAFGRAARKGEPGTAQLILEENNTKERLKILDKTHLTSCAEVKNKRNEVEKTQLHKIGKSTLRCIENKDKLFARYLKLREEFFEHDKDNTGWAKELRSSVRKNFLFYKLKAADERWGIWLKQMDLDSETIIEDYDEFEKQLLEDYKEDKIIINPHYYMNMGAYCLSYVRSRAGRYLPFYYQYYAKLALDMYSKALELCEGEDKKTAFLAYYYRAYASLKLDGLAHKENAKEDTNNFIHQIQMRLDELNLYSEGALPVGKPDHHCEDELQAHLLYQLKLYNIMLSSARQNLKEIEQSQKLADITIQQVDSYQKISYLDKNQAKESITSNQCKTVTIGFRNVKNASDMASNKAAGLIKKLKNHSDYGLHYSSDQLGDGNEAKQALLNLLPINAWGKINQLNKENSGNSDLQEEVQIQESSVQIESDNEDVIGTTANLQYLWEGAYNAFERGCSTTKKLVQSNTIARNTVNCLTAMGSAVYAGASAAVKKISSFSDYIVFLKNKRKEAIKIKTSLQFEFNSVKQSVLWFEHNVDKVPLSNMRMTLQGLTFEQVKLIQDMLTSEIEISCYSLEKYSDHHMVFSQVQQRNKLPENIQYMLTIPACSQSDIKSILSELQKIPEPISFESCDLSEMNLPEMNLSEVTALLKTTHLTTAQFQIKIDYTDISQEQAHNLIKDTNLDQCKMTLSFDHLSRKHAKLMSTWNRNHSDDAHIVCYDLKCDDAIIAIDQVHEEEQPFYLPDRVITEDLKDVPQIDTWFPESKLNGFDFLYTLEESSPIPWHGIAFSLGAGVAQIGIGFLIGGLTFGIGFNIATAFVAEGIGDFIKAGIAAYTRSFSMEDYLKGKGIAILIASVTVGISAIEAAIVAARAAAAGVAVESSTASVSTNLANLGIQMGRCATTNSASGTFNFITTSGVEGLYNWLKAQAEATIKTEIDRVLYSGRVIGYIKRIVAYDKSLNNNPLKRDSYRFKLLNKMLGIINQVDRDDFNAFEDKLVTYLEQQFKDKWSLSNVFCKYLDKKGYILTSEQKIELIEMLKNQGILNDTSISIQAFADAYTGQGQNKYLASDYDYDRLPFKQEIWYHTDCILNACLDYARFNHRSLAYTHELASLSLPLIDAFWKKSEAFLKTSINTLNSLCRAGNEIAAGAIGGTIKDKKTTLSSSGEASNTKQTLSTEKKSTQGIENTPSSNPSTSSKQSLGNIIGSISLGMNLGTDIGSSIYVYNKIISIDKKYQKKINEINDNYIDLAKRTRDHRNLMTSNYHLIFQTLLTYIFKSRCLLGFVKENFRDDKSIVDAKFEDYCNQQLQNDLNTFEKSLTEKAEQSGDLLRFAFNFFDDHANKQRDLIKKLIQIYEKFYQLKNQKKEITMADNDTTKNGENTVVSSVNSSELVRDYLSSSRQGPSANNSQLVTVNPGNDENTNRNLLITNGLLHGANMLLSTARDIRQCGVIERVSDNEIIKSEHRRDESLAETNRQILQDRNNVDISIATLISGVNESKGQINQKVLETKCDGDSNECHTTHARLQELLFRDNSISAAETRRDLLKIWSQPNEHNIVHEPMEARSAIQSETQPSPAAASEEQIADEFSPLNRSIMTKISSMLRSEYGDLDMKPKFKMYQEGDVFLQEVTISLTDETKHLAGVDDDFKTDAEGIIESIKASLENSNYQLVKYRYNNGKLIIHYSPNGVPNLGGSMFTLFKSRFIAEEEERFENNKTISCAVQ